MKSTAFFFFVIAGLLSSPVLANYYYTTGHADIGLGEGGRLELHLHAHEGAAINGIPLLGDAEYELDDVVIIVPNTTLFQRPQDAIWDFLGNGPGQNTWQLPQSRTDADEWNAPYLGIGAEEIDLGIFEGDVLTLTLLAVDGPGYFSLYRVSLAEPTVFMTTSDGIGSDDALQVQAGRHRHFNFAFTEPGDYRITFEVSAVHLQEGAMTQQATYTFRVVPEPATLSLLMVGAVGGRRRQK